MNQKTSPFKLTKKVRLLLTKKELEFVHRVSRADLNSHSEHRLRQYLKMSNNLRQKYRELTQRQKATNKSSDNLRTIEKARVFDQMVSALRKQTRRVRTYDQQ